MAFTGFSFSKVFDATQWPKFIAALSSVFDAVGPLAVGNFDGTAAGTTTPRSSRGVTNVVRTATGLWTVNCKVTLPANYSVVVNGGPLSSAGVALLHAYGYGTSAFKIAGFNSSFAAADCANINFAVFGN